MKAIALVCFLITVCGFLTTVIVGATPLFVLFQMVCVLLSGLVLYNFYSED